MARRAATARAEKGRSGSARLGFRLDDTTRALVERAASLERRSLTDFCLTTLAEAARQTIARHETLVLSERDRQVFFDTLMYPPALHPRLRRGFEAERTRIDR